MDIKKITKKQHYVPQVYLRGFSDDKKHLWSYRLNSSLEGKMVPIESVCRKHFLYEVRGNNGEIVTPNWIERVLSELEKMFASYLRMLEAKAFHKENYKTKCFLRNDEKIFWKVYAAVQMMRSPEVINVAHSTAKELLGEILNDSEAYTAAITQCLPFFTVLNQDSRNVFLSFLQPLNNMSIAIGVDKQETIFTSDDPVYCYSSQREIVKITEYDKVILPLTPKLVLLLFGNEEKKEYDKNRLFPLEQENKEDIKKSIAYCAQSWIFSKRELSSDDKEIIRQVRIDKQEDKNMLNEQ